MITRQNWLSELHEIDDKNNRHRLILVSLVSSLSYNVTDEQMDIAFERALRVTEEKKDVKKD